MATCLTDRVFDLRLSNPAFNTKTGRKRKEINIIPENILNLDAEWSKGIQKAHRSKLLCNIPVEYLALFSHADSNKVYTLKGKNIVTNDDIEFSPTYFKSKDSKDFSLVNLFTLQMTTTNRISTKFRAFSNNWHAMINSIPWRHNEVMCLLTIYSFIESQFYSQDNFKVTLKELVKECAKKSEKMEFIRSLYTLLVLQDTEIFIVDSESNIIVSKKKLFNIKCTDHSIQSLALELKKVENNNSSELLKLLSLFEVDFKYGALGDIENNHKIETGELPPNFIQTKSKKKPDYWKNRIYKGGHFFHCLHPHLNLPPVIIRLWSLFSAYQPNMTTRFTDLVKGFNIETFAAITGLSNVMNHKQNKFQEYLDEISKYWGGIEIKNNNLFIKFGYDKKIMTSLVNKEEVKNYDLNYGIVNFKLNEENPIKEDKLKNVTIDQLIEALSKFKLREDDAIEFAELAKLKNFAQTKITGKQINLNEKQEYEKQKIPLELKKNKKDSIGNDFFKNILISRIDNLQGKNICGTSGDLIRQNFLEAIERGDNQSLISIQLEKIEQLIFQ